MLNKILVAMDRSETGKQVFDEALALAKATGASLMLLHVLSIEEKGSPYVSMLYGPEYYPGLSGKNIEIYREQWNTFEAQGVELLRSRREVATSVGVDTDFNQILSSSPGRAICDFAESWGADLLVTGRRGYSGIKELFLGSVSNYVLHHAPCSVLTVQPSVVNTSTQRYSSNPGSISAI